MPAVVVAAASPATRETVGAASRCGRSASEVDRLRAEAQITAATPATARTTATTWPSAPRIGIAWTHYGTTEGKGKHGAVPGEERAFVLQSRLCHHLISTPTRTAATSRVRT